MNKPHIYAPLNSEPIPMLQRIEISTSFQLPTFHIIGLPAPEVAEARERVRSAIESMGAVFPKRKIILNLSPASIRKRGTGLDLAMALSILTLGNSQEGEWVAWGELGLDGKVKPVGQMTRTLFSTWKKGVPFLLISKGDEIAAREALRYLTQRKEAFEERAPVILPVESLREAWELVKRGGGFESQLRESHSTSNPLDSPAETLKLEFSQSHLLPISPVLERVLSLVVSGQHHLLLLGPRGAGKSHAIEWITSSRNIISSNTKGLRFSSEKDDDLQHVLLSEMREIGPYAKGWRSSTDCRRIVRRVGSQVRPSALVGFVSSQWIIPGEFSLAHGGILIADEFMEWSKDSREAFREPLERGAVTLSRARGSVEFPSSFQFIANGNLCPCGGWPSEVSQVFHNDGTHDQALLRCRCSSTQKKEYFSRLSGPILDRIDVTFLLFQNEEKGKSLYLCENPSTQFERFCNHVCQAQEKMILQWGKIPGKLTGSELEGILKSSPEIAGLLNQCAFPSLRSRHKVLRLALSLCVLDGKDVPEAAHFAEAQFYRGDRLFESVS